MATLWLALVLLAVCAVLALITRAVSGHWANALVMLFFAVIIGLFVFIGEYTSNFHNDHWVTCHVTDKDRGGTDGTYRVYTSDCGTLGNHDTRFRLKTNSADVQGQIQPGHTYRFHVAGARISWWSWFPNILEVQSAD